MQLISHRGNVLGPVPDKENNPNYIDLAIKSGYMELGTIQLIKSKFLNVLIIIFIEIIFQKIMN